MKIVRKISWGYVDPIIEVNDWADESIMQEIKKEFGEVERPTLWDGFPNARLLINEDNMPC